MTTDLTISINKQDVLNQLVTDYETNKKNYNSLVEKFNSSIKSINLMFGSILLSGLSQVEFKTVFSHLSPNGSTGSITVLAYIHGENKLLSTHVVDVIYNTETGSYSLEYNNHSINEPIQIGNWVDPDIVKNIEESVLFKISQLKTLIKFDRVIEQNKASEALYEFKNFLSEKNALINSESKLAASAKLAFNEILHKTLSILNVDKKPVLQHDFFDFVSSPETNKAFTMYSVSIFSDDQKKYALMENKIEIIKDEDRYRFSDSGDEILFEEFYSLIDSCYQESIIPEKISVTLMR